MDELSLSGESEFQEIEIDVGFAQSVSKSTVSGFQRHVYDRGMMMESIIKLRGKDMLARTETHKCNGRVGKGKTN